MKKSNVLLKVIVAVASVLVFIAVVLLVLFLIMRKSGEDKLITDIKPALPTFEDFTDESRVSAPAAVVTVVVPDGAVGLSTYVTSEPPAPPTAGVAESSAWSDEPSASPEITTAPPIAVDVVYNGSGYNYNDNLINVILMGVDKNSEDGGQHTADAIFLLSVDPVASKVNIIPISRDTIVPVNFTDIYGGYLYTVDAQLCLAYAFGGSERECSDLVRSAVSGLFYGLPIQSYGTLYMDGVGKLVDAVGGVTVTVNEDLTYISPEMTNGAVVTLNGDNAILYLRRRRTDITEGNALRLERQKGFISAFVSSAKKAMLANPGIALKAYNDVMPYCNTDVGADTAVYLASVMANSEFVMHRIDGTVGSDGTHATFAADKRQLYELILEVFYSKIY